MRVPPIELEPEKWEAVSDLTSRLRVPGGWIYRYASLSGVGLAFVPWPEPVDASVEVAS